jgi:exopolysaccharide biosynthesis protein
MKELQPGSRAMIVTDWATPAFADCAYLIQAGPMLVESGSRVSGHGGYRANFLKRRHPRTIMGTDGKRFVWAVIDGRNPIHSVGATIEETGRVAGLLGLQTAINLDGGGSSQMVWRDIIVNLPSEGRERPLPYAVLFHSKAE